MALIEFLRDLGLDVELIARDRDMSAGFGHGHAQRAAESDTDRFLRETAAATEFRRAGAHSILLSDQKAAAENFRLAGQAYARAANPYALLMYLCADFFPNDLPYTAREFGFLEGRIADRLQIPYLLLAAAGGGWSEQVPREYFDRIGGSLTSPIGLLGLPAGCYLDLAVALERHEQQAVARALLPFLTAYNNALRGARENDYHWKMLAMPFHPAEPDILSVLFLVQSAMRGEAGLIQELLRTVPLFPETAGILRNALTDKFGEYRG